MFPSCVVSNQDLRETHGFDPDWIVNRTGIHERRFALPHQATSDLCNQAAIRCLKAARREPADVDLLVVGTFTPDMAFPATANLIQDRLKLICPAFDVQAACAGFVFALVIAAQFVATGNSRCALVIGGDCNSRVINPGDQKSFPALRRRCRRGAARRRAQPIRGWWPTSSGPTARAATS